MTVTDTLRDRIAAAIDEERNRWAGGDAPAETLADAVIAELGLRIQVAGPDGIVGTGNYRYVTEWETDE